MAFLLNTPPTVSPIVTPHLPTTNKPCNLLQRLFQGIFCRPIMNPTLSSSTTLQSPPDYTSPDEKLHDSLGDLKPALPNPYLHLNHPFTANKHPPRGIRFSDPRFNFLSHSSGHIILFANRRWPSAGHLYHALKFASPVIRRKVRHAPSPDAASLLAKKHTAFVKPDWLDVSRLVLSSLSSRRLDSKCIFTATA